ncbi:tautomerase family protein [Nitrospirillum viridazoti]|uniref:Tautomerase-like protein n=1 Tax=Nitrospirillum amazonense TaxID=28077 RepID=A0A560HSN9_9PROT|nr:tautomerase family protein [Nitrospirillum amazonense]TWB49608.1 tautomerase-like protein [Nitrospirillum amazonense]
MPLVRISLIKGKPAAHIRAIADGVHQALTDTFGVPADDRFQLIDQHERDTFLYDADYLGVHRTDDLVMITILASNWRDTAQKQALYRAIAENLTRAPGLRPEDVMVVLAPNQRDDWSFGNGLASYITPA